MTMTEPGESRESEAPLPDYSKDGVDLSLIRWMLSLTPAERLRFAEDQANGIRAIRERNDRKQLRSNSSQP